MAQTVDNSLEQRIADLESAVRSLRATNLTDLASVVDASGNPVPLSGLAFGQVAAIWAGVGVVHIDAAPSFTADGKTASPVPTATPTPGAWYQPSPGLQLDVLVRGGRLRIDWAALLAMVGGNGNAYGVMSYSLDYLGDVNTHGTVPLSRPVPLDYYRAIQIRDNAAQGATVQSGNWYMHTGLTPGWYRVRAGWFHGYTSTATIVPHIDCDNPRIAATPF